MQQTALPRSNTACRTGDREQLFCRQVAQPHLDTHTEEPTQTIRKGRLAKSRPPLLTQKGPAISPALCYSPLGSGLLHRAPAAAASAGVATFTLICLGFASSRFLMLSVSTPFSSSALVSSELTASS